MDIGPIHPTIKQFDYDGRLTAMWDFRGGNINSQDCLRDLSGNAHDLTIRGVLTCYPGLGFLFANNGNNRLEAAASVDFDISREISIVARVTRDSATVTNRMIICRSRPTGGVATRDWEYRHNTAFRPQMVCCDGVAAAGSNSNTIMNANQVYVVGLTAEYTPPNEVRHFTDSAFINTTAPARVPQNLNLPITIGAADDIAQPWSGYISVVAVFNDMLTDDELIRVQQSVEFTGSYPYSHWLEKQRRR